MRPGFTLIEAIVALVVFQIAALAIAATTAVAARDLAVATRHTRAHAMAQDRVARLRAAACAGATGGSRLHAGGFDERWSVSGDEALRAVADSVAFDLPGGRRGAVVVRGWEVCPP